MLVLKRRTWERLYLFTANGPIAVTVVERADGSMRLGIDADRSVVVVRGEILTTEQQDQCRAARIPY